MPLVTSRRLLAAVLILACGFVAGLVITARIRSTTDASAQAPAGVQAPAVGGAAAIPASVPAADFTGIAERTVPAVANISSVQIVRRPNSPFANDPFFQFFGDDMFGSRRGVENSLGSGVVISADGYLLTNNHVVVGESGTRLSAVPQITVSLGTLRDVQAQIIGTDPATDLALLKVDAQGLPTIPWGDSDKLKVAEWVLAIGNPFELSQSVSLGIVSALGRRVGISSYEDFIQTDAAINPGNSGGALVNSRGELVGINTAIFSQSGGYQGIGFAVPSKLARQVVSELQQFGEVRRGTIGRVELVPLSPRIAAELGYTGTQGVVVSRIAPGSSAYRGGLRAADIILAFNGQDVGDGSQLPRTISDAAIGSTAAMTVVRNGRQIELKIPIESTAQQR
jgi:Do/DeqQ family serine protease